MGVVPKRESVPSFSGNHSHDMSHNCVMYDDIYEHYENEQIGDFTIS